MQCVNTHYLCVGELRSAKRKLREMQGIRDRERGRKVRRKDLMHVRTPFSKILAHHLAYSACAGRIKNCFA